jgi:hypothetical protein
MASSTIQNRLAEANNKPLETACQPLEIMMGIAINPTAVGTSVTMAMIGVAMGGRPSPVAPLDNPPANRPAAAIAKAGSVQSIAVQPPMPEQITMTQGIGAHPVPVEKGPAAC